MDDPEQVRAYADAGRADGLMAAAYLFHTARISQVIQGCREVVDLGCGPATQLCQVAALNPAIRFTGVDLSPSMLASARAHVAEYKLDNVALAEGDITRLDAFPSASVDGVVSTLAPPPSSVLRRTSKPAFDEIARILRPGGAIYLADFGRLKSLKSVLFFAYMNAKHQPHVFSLDYERSLRAAFLADELRAAAAQCCRNAFASTARSSRRSSSSPRPVRPLPSALKSRFAAMRKRLARRYRTDLDELRQFFRLGGMPGDAFR